MNEAEFEIQRWRMRATAAAELAEWLAGTLWAVRRLHGEPLSSQLLSELEDSISHWGKVNEKVTFPSRPAAESDLLAAEYQDAWSALSARVMMKVKGLDPG